VRRTRLALFAFAAVPLATGLSATALSAQNHDGHDGGPTMPRGFDEPMPLHHDGKGLGPFTRSITTDSEQAQLYFDQGLQLLYAFDPNLAARSFREAWKYDPECAMCYLGEAWAWGPYLNGPMVSDDAPRAHHAIMRAMELRDGADPVERALIEAMAVRYEHTHERDRRRELDEAWAEKVNELYEAHPSDLDIGFLAGESLMLLQPRREWWEIGNPEIRRIHTVLESVLDQDITHPGACHLYVHATERTVVPEKAEACAEHLGSSIPGASHIQHMPSHTFNRVGRWAESVRGNLAAWHSDQKAEHGLGFAIYPSHNLHMLFFAAANDAQAGVAIQATRDYATLMDDGQFYTALLMMRFGRFEEMLAMEDDAPGGTIFRGLWDAAMGYAHLKTGNPGKARRLLVGVRQAAREAGDSQSFRRHPGEDLLGIMAGILEGEIARSEGDHDSAIAALEAAVEIEDGLMYDEPEPLPFSARHWLGDVLHETGRHEEAAEVFRAELVDHPHNAWSLFGLERSLRALGREAEADEVQVEFEEASARSDVWIRGPIF